MWLDMMRHVDEVAARGAETTNETDGIVNGLMTGMGLVTKGIDDEGVDALQHLHVLVGNGGHVGDVGEIMDAEADNGQPAVHDADRDDVDRSCVALKDDGNMRLDAVEVDGWHSWITILLRSETIGNTFHKVIGTEGFGIYINIAKDAVGAKIIKSANVIIVFVCNEHCMKWFEVDAKHLGTKIRSAVDKDIAAINLDESRAAEALITWVGG